MKKQVSILLLIAFLVVISIYSISTFADYSISTNRKFNTTNSVLYLNWTNGYTSPNITIMGNVSSTENITLEILNTTFIANYSQQNDQTACDPSHFAIIVQNSTGNSSSLGNIVAGAINGSSSNYNISNSTYVFINTFVCRPGRYWIQNLTIRNYTNSTEHLNISVILDVPISSNSTGYELSVSTGVGRFDGTIRPNASTYYSYYLNATSMNYTSLTNVTSITINLTGWVSVQDLDLFLFDNSGDLKAKSINKTATQEWLTYSYLPTSSQMWEIRVYGNSTNSSGIPYTGYIIYSTLNITNASNTNQQISSINFGNLNVSNTSSINLTLKNEGGINLTNVMESKELYYLQRFAGNGSQNITFFVPNSTISSRVKVSLNWTGASNYSFNVYKSDGSLATSSVNRYFNANITNAMQEEYNETSDVGSTNGYWKIAVRNNTNAINEYNLTIYAYVDAAKWITTNYTNSTSGFTFNTTGLPNSTYTVQVNLTAQNDTLNGTYEGYLQYKSDSSGATVRIPIQVAVKSGMLLVNNSMGSSTVQIDENTGANIIKVLNITYNNTGSYGLSFTNTNSSNILNLSSSNNKNISFFYGILPSTISAGSSGIINITINITNVTTSDTAGLYEGYILFSTNDSRPYQNLTLNLKVNLNNSLAVGFSSITPSTTTSTSAQDVTLVLTLKYLNGTELGEPYSINASNFTSVWLVSSNYSNYRIPTTGSVNVANGTNPLYDSSLYNVNVTIPANMPGGAYEAYVIANYTRNDNKAFGGYGISSNQGKYLIINNTGLLMSTNFTGCSFGSSCYPSITLNPGNSTGIYVNVTNYGPLTSVGTSINNITFSNPCTTYYTVSSPIYANCPSTSFAPTGYSSNCTAYWTITATSTPGTCRSSIIGNGNWFNPYGINITITVPNLTTSTTPPGGTTTPTTPTTTYNLEFSKAETLIPVQQNSSNFTEVGVRNTGNTSQNVTFKLEGINSTWYIINSTSATIFSGGTAGFRITFTIGKEEVKDYSGKYNATSPTKSIAKNFTLRVLPALEEKIKINDTLALYKANMTILETEINQSREKGINVTLAEQKLKELKANISQAENYTKVEDYFNANQLLPTIKSLIDDTRNELAKAKEIVSEAHKKRVWIFVGIGGGLAAIGVIVYLFWPSKGYHAEGKVYFSEKESLFKRLKTKLSIFGKKVKK